MLPSIQHLYSKHIQLKLINSIKNESIMEKILILSISLLPKCIALEPGIIFLCKLNIYYFTRELSGY